MSHFLDSQVYPTPRVRVKEQEEEDGQVVSPPNDTGSFLFLRLLESLSLQDCSLPKENHCNSSPANAKVTKTSASKEKKKNKDSKQSGRAISILRPRAVLSSPENDGMIGNKNKLQKYGRPSSSKSLNPEQKITTTISNPIKPRSPLSSRKGSRDATSDNKRLQTQTKSSK
ncbi:hypothetical protein LWI28_025743 [Acer negundo]|uniref:Uncharacterized protein n=1 Tax=Acer negundo TaxID=4023 RepID=A0AAD5J1P2_ACENE|nr:hypothetical protein LWI28_025743 [Acer negundo]KAK4849513.1 hypothetical protein QYF36_025652 [Acer negundo]